jgi:hypothetical protein
MGAIFSSKKENSINSQNYRQRLLDEEAIINANFIDPLKFEINKIKDNNQKLFVEIKSLHDKIDRLELDINKIQTNHGKEIYGLNQGLTSIQQDVDTLLNNQRIFSEVLQNNSVVNTPAGSIFKN